MKELNLKLKRRIKTDENLVDANGELIPFNDYYIEFVNKNTGENEEYRLKPADMTSKKLLKDYFTATNDNDLTIYGETRSTTNSEGVKIAYHVFAVEVVDLNFDKKHLCYIQPVGGNAFTNYILINSLLAN